MARAKQYEDYYGSEYLTPGQKIDEDYRLAQQASPAAIRAEQAAVNPLLAARDLGLVPATAEAASVSAAPNPFTRPTTIQPPVPLSSMPVEQQMAWQEQAAKEAKAQADQLAAQKLMLDTETARRQGEFEAEQLKQGTEMMSEIPALQEKLMKPDAKIEDYGLARADLARRFPAGVESPKAQHVLGQLDRIYQGKVTAEDQRATAELNRKGIAQQARLTEGVKEALTYGADVAREYARLAEISPDKASEFLARAQQEDRKQQLRDVGKTEEEIAQFQTPGGGFNIRAAEAEVKRRVSPGLELQRATNIYLAVEKEKKEAGEDWTDQDQIRLQGLRDYANSLTPKVGGNRAGLQGMENFPMLPQGETYTKGQQQPAVTAQGEPAHSLPGSRAIGAALQRPWVEALSAPQPASPVRSEAPLAWMLQPGRERAAAAEPAVVTQPPTVAATPPPPQEKIIRNPKTGERQALRMRNGKWAYEPI